MVSDNDLFAIAAATALGGVLLVYMLWPDGRIPTDPTDGPGPNLVVTMGGEADGIFVIDLYTDRAPQNAERLIQLAEAGYFANVSFHRVIEGFMAQTGDVQFGRIDLEDTSRAGFGKSELPDVPAEISDVKFERGIVGMARGPDPNSANSQFFIMFDRAANLDGQYTAVGHVVAGMEVVDQIKKGDPIENGTVDFPDFMVSVKVQR